MRPLTPGCPASCDYKQTKPEDYNLLVIQPLAKIMYLYSPGHTVLLHGFVSLAFPLHPLPPFDCGGLLHNRTRVTSPSPHVVVHADQGDQWPQFPSARPRHETNMYEFWK